MKAVIVHEYGGPEVLSYENAPNPIARSGEVLVRVAATSINPFDIMRRTGAVKDQAPIKFPGIVGVDVSGTVEAVGAGVEAFAVGDHVFSIADSTYAELCVVPATSLAKVPSGFDLIDAAAIPLVTTTGNMLITEGTSIKAGQTILVTGANGNVGRSAVYTAKKLGARVIAAVLASQLKDAAQIGADEVVATDDPTAMDKLTMVDAVADTVAGKTGELVISKVKPGGVFATVLYPPSNATQYPQVRVTTVYAKPNPGVLLEMAGAVLEGKLTIPIGQKIPMSDAAKAHAAIAQGKARGKTLLVSAGISPEIAQAQDEVKKLLVAYNAALNSSKTASVIPLYAEDGIFMPPYSDSAVGLDAIGKAYDEVFVTRKFDVVFHLAELVIIAPDWAYGRTNSAGHTTNPLTGVQSSEGNQELFLFHKGWDGAWKISRYSFSPTTPPK